MYDPANAAQRAALKTEIQTDPVALGYAALVAVGNHDGIAALLNTVRGGASAVWRDDVASDALRSRVTKSDFAALAAADRTYVEFLLGGATLDLTVAQLRTDLSAVFPGGSATRTAWVAVAQKLPTRGEELFGVGTVLTAAGVGAALNN